MALTKEQLAERKVGGSDVATILGLNPWKTPLELYAEARGEIERVNLDDNDLVYAGSLFEDSIAKFAERKLSRRDGREVKFRKINKAVVNKKWPWLTVHIDRDIVGEERGVEIKNVGYHAARGWGPEGTDQIPEHYLPQVHTYIGVMEYPEFVEAAYFGGADLRLYDIPASKAFFDLIVEETHAFWHNHVLAGVPPQFDATHPGAEQAIRRVFSGTNGATVASTEVIEAYKTVWLAEQANAKLAETAEKIAKARLLRYMEDAAILTFADGSRLERKLVKVKEFVQPAKEYMNARLVKPRSKKDQTPEENEA